MENAVILLIIIVVCIFGIKSYAERLTQGCCGTGGGGERKVRVKDKKKEKEIKRNVKRKGAVRTGRLPSAGRFLFLRRRKISG